MKIPEIPQPASPAAQTAFERQLATLIVTALHLELAPADIEPDATLFGEGLGLDSIDALEMAVAIARDYGVELKSDEQSRAVFTSLRSLASHIEANRTK